MQTVNKTLYLLDGHAIVYKYYYAYERNPLINSKGEDVGAVYGMAQVLSKLLNYFPLTHIAVIFDSPTGYYRKEHYPEYKATRKSPDNIKPKIARAYEMIKRWGIYTSAFDRFEADDIVGALAKKAVPEGFECVLVTKDKDYAQLVNDKVKMLDLGKTIGKEEATFIDEDGVKEKFGVRPDQIPDYLALVGDTSDNIKGVDGVGKKGAPELLAKYGTIEGIYDNLEDLTKSKRMKFKAAAEDLKLTRWLVQLHTDVSLPITTDDLKRPTGVSPALLEYLQELEFFSIIKEINP